MFLIMVVYITDFTDQNEYSYVLRSASPIVSIQSTVCRRAAMRVTYVHPHSPLRSIGVIE